MKSITEAQINDWKKKHEDIYEISVDNKKGYFRRPDRSTLSLFLSLQDKPMEANEALARNCFLGGDNALLEQDSLFFAVVSKLSELLKLKDAQIKKL